MLHTKFHGNRPAGSGEEDFCVVFTIYGRGGHLGFYHIWAWWPSWSCDQDPANKLLFPLPMDAPHKTWLSSAKRFQRRRCLKIINVNRRTHGRTPARLLYYNFG